MSDILKQVTDSYREDLQDSEQSPAVVLQDTGFVASFKAETDLSSAYKESVRGIVLSKRFRTPTRKSDSLR